MFTKTKAKLTWFDDGAIVIEPYRKSGTRRYEQIFETDYGTVSTTKQDYRVVLKFPRKSGIIAAAYHLICEASRISSRLIQLSKKTDSQ